MTKEQIALVQLSWGRIGIHKNQLISAFYQHLFTEYPSLREMFSGNLEDQKLKMIQTLNLLINGIEHLVHTRTMLEDLGRQHQQLGVTKEMYPLTTGSFLLALDELQGNPVSEPEREAWHAAFNTIAEIMIGAYE